MQKNALIIGYGSSGISAANLLKKHGYKVFVFDDQKLSISDDQVIIDQFQELELSIVILSPGIHPMHPACQKIHELDILLVGEAEFALSFLPQRKIGITGTNGKTTVTYLCEHILKKAGYNAIACGNVSKQKALSQIALDCPHDAVLCVELSSFQLETLNSPKFEAGIILNITPDHLDRYDGMIEYASSKFRLRHVSDSFYVFKSVNDEFRMLQQATDILYNIEPSEPFLGLDFESYIDKLNLYSCYNLLRSFKISDELFIEAFRSFKKPSHRLQKIAHIEGVDFINDSKATNIDATIQALRSMTKPVILLAGGVDKGHPYSDWIPHLKTVKKIICFGASKEIIFEQLKLHVTCEKVSNLQEAVSLAHESARSGDVVLLSPGCSSFDEFKDYQDRGEKFCQNVHNLKLKETLL